MATRASHLPCPYCRHVKTLVKYIGAKVSRAGLKRRRQCDRCKKTFTTVERFDFSRKNDLP